MSSASFAALRRSQGDELAKLAEEHFKHDLQDQDKQALMKAASQFTIYAGIGSVIGIGLGAFLAFRVRSARTKMFEAFRAAERPTKVVFANGREEAIPDITPFVKPTPLGDIAAYTFFSLGGLFLFGELGVLAGSWSAKRSITQDPAVKQRIETAFKNFRVDMLKKQIEDLEGNKEKEILSF